MRPRIPAYITHLSCAECSMESDAVEKTLFVGQVPLHSTVEDVTSWFATFGQIKVEHPEPTAYLIRTLHTSDPFQGSASGCPPLCW